MSALLAIAFGTGGAHAQSPDSGEDADAASQDGSTRDGPSSDDDASGSPDELATGNGSLQLTIAGQVNRGVLFYDDGQGTGAIHVDNDNSSTRLRFAAESTSFDPLVLGARIEVEFQSNPSNLVSQEDQRDVGSDTFDERKLEVYAKSGTWGDLLIGQGSTASDGTAEIDLSGTGVAGYSDVDDTGGGLVFMSGGTATGTNVRGVFASLDGLGRDDRLRYDSPRFANLVASVSFAADRARDVALRWDRAPEGASWKAAAAVSHADLGDGGGDDDGDIGVSAN